MTHKILMVSEQCPACSTIEKYLKEKGLLDKFRVLDIATEEGQKLVKELDLKAVPNCVIVDDERKEIRQCSGEEWKRMLEGK